MIFQFNLGIDIQDDKLMISQVKPSYRGIHLESYGVYSLDREIPIQEKLGAVRALIEDFKKEKKIGSTDTYLGIPADLVMFREIDLPLTVKENLNTALKYEIGKHIPLSVEDIYYDHQVIHEDRKQNLLRIFLVIVKKKTFQPYLDFCQTLPGGISGIEVSSTALANSIFYFQESEDSSLKEILFRIAANGGNFSDHISNLDLPSIPDRKRPSSQLLLSCGLALKNLCNVPLQINLLPDHFQKRPGRIGKYTMIALAVLMFLSILTWGGSQLFRHRMILAGLGSEIERLSPEIDRIETIRGEIEEGRQYLDQFDGLYKEDVPVIDILREITQILPENAWISEFFLNNEQIRLNGFADSASDLIGILESSPILRDAVFLSTIVKEDNGKERFNIGLSVVPYKNSKEAANS